MPAVADASVFCYASKRESPRARGITSYIVHLNASRCHLLLLSGQVMGSNIEQGEILQLLVGTNVWKKSCLLEEDLRAASAYHISGSVSNYLLIDV